MFIWLTSSITEQTMECLYMPGKFAHIHIHSHEHRFRFITPHWLDLLKYRIEILGNIINVYYWYMIGSSGLLFIMWDHCYDKLWPAECIDIHRIANTR